MLFLLNIISLSLNSVREGSLSNGVLPVYFTLEAIHTQNKKRHH